MNSEKINNKLLKLFVKKATDRLSGDWVILGGSVLQLLDIDVRVTTDIDLAGPETATQGDMATLMDIAQELGLPIEAINQAASYFLYKMPDWRDSITLVYKGRLGAIYRPNANLFLKLKAARMTESDLLDCKSMIDYCATSREHVDVKGVTTFIRKCIKKEENKDKRARLEMLLDKISPKP